MEEPTAAPAPEADKPVPWQRGFARYQREVEHLEPGAWLGDETQPDFVVAPVPGAHDGESAVFHFQLHGGAGPRTVRVGVLAELRFALAVPAEQLLALLDSEELEAARRASLDIDLRATGYGDLSVDQPCWGIARFEQGQLAEPVRFQLRAAMATGTASGVHVTFAVRGELVHAADLPLGVTGGDAARPPPAAARGAADAVPPPAGGVSPRLLLDALDPPRPPRHRIELSLSMQPGLHVDLAHFRCGQTEHRQTYHAPGFGIEALGALLRQVYRDVAKGYVGSAIWHDFDGTVQEGAPGSAVREGLARALSAVARAGDRLFYELHRQGDIGAMLDYVEQHLEDGGVITVYTDHVFLPWEILYPLRAGARTGEAAGQDGSAARAERFWGARWALETIQRGAAPVGRLRRAHCAAPPQVSVNMNPTLRTHAPTGTRRGPIDLQEDWADGLRQRGLLAGVQQCCEDIQAALMGRKTAATLFYVYCHADSAMTGAPDGDELQLDHGCSLDPLALRDAVPYENAPIVFLNACSTGTYLPLPLSTFLTRFREAGALGLIATTASIPVMFGAHFGTEVVEAYLGRGSGSLATALLQLRRRHTVERGNPVPLFYTLQCQL